MTRLATDRLLVAALVSAGGALLAVLGGLPEAAILAAPWAVLAVLGLSNHGPREAKIAICAATDRLLVGDEVEVITSISEAAGSASVTVVPSPGFWPRSSRGPHQQDGRASDAVINGRTTIRCSLPASQWGTHDVGNVQIVLTEPYGLLRSERTEVQPTPIRVHPRPADLHNLLAPWLVRRVAGAHRSRATGRGIEYADLRPYSPGDSLREINWRASARSADLWVSQRHPDRATDVILLLDSFIESGHDVHTAVGLAIEAAVALAESHLAVTDRVGLIELGGVVRWVSPGTGRLQLQRLVDALLQTGLYANVASRSLTILPPRALPPRSFVVALTPLLDDRFIDSLFVLGARGHDVAVVECESADLAAGDRAAGETARLVNRFWQADRQIIRDRLAENGIAVARWQQGRLLDLTLDELSRRRLRTVRGGRR